MLSPEQDEAQLVLGLGGGYKRGREAAPGFWSWERCYRRALVEWGLYLLLKLLAEHRDFSTRVGFGFCRL